MSKGNDLTLSELREIAKIHGIKGISTLRKDELMALLYNVSKKEKEEREAAERAAGGGDISAVEADVLQRQGPGVFEHAAASLASGDDGAIRLFVILPIITVHS